MQKVEVKKDIYWVGARNPDLRVFDIIMKTEYGTTYNSYLVQGSEKTAIFETVKDRFFDDFIEKIEAICPPESIDYIVINHTEPDHTGSLLKLLERCPNATVVGTAAAIRFLGGITNTHFQSMTVIDGDVIRLGNKTVRFLSVPFLHWPDTMFSYIEEDKVLISCDSFGCHYCGEAIFNDELKDDFQDAYRYYFDMIMGPFKNHVVTMLAKIEGLPIEMICPGHGPVLRSNIEKYVNDYKQWSKPETRDKKSVVIAYVSAYGYTKALALKIAEGIQSVLACDIFLHDMVDADENAVFARIQEADGVLFGSPTLVGDALPPIWNLVNRLNPVVHKGKAAAAFGSYGWSGEAVPYLTERFKQLKLRTMEGLKINLNPSEKEQQQAFDFGVAFAEHVEAN